MASHGLLIKLVCALVVVMVAVTPTAQAALECGEVQSDLSGCFAWLSKIDSVVKPNCCDGVKRLDNKVKGNVDDTKKACKCLRQYYQDALLYTERADQIPKKCNCTLSYEINPHSCPN
ncbi:hypothetical protein Drorol1_Dr00004740 [Drosera rotundifolia]